MEQSETGCAFQEETRDAGLLQRTNDVASPTPTITLCSVRATKRPTPTHTTDSCLDMHGREASKVVPTVDGPGFDTGSHLEGKIGG